jgi:hypothetical protein
MKGVDCTLNFVRGGWTTFNDGVSFHPQPYVKLQRLRADDRFRNAVASTYKAIESDPSLMTDGRRVAMQVIYV